MFGATAFSEAGGVTMRIESSDLQMASQHRATSRESVQESLKVWGGAQRPEVERREARQAVDAVSISQQAMAAAQADEAARALSTTPQGAEAIGDDVESALENDPRYRLIVLMIEAMTGRKVKLFDLQEIQGGAGAVGNVAGNTGGGSTATARPAGVGVEYTRRTVRDESERTSFAAQGVVRTADGREIRVNVALTMERSFHSETELNLRLGAAEPKTKDPLVINFGGTAAQLSDLKFNFDLDADGSTENIAFVGSGSGFLALDRNGDGRINDGSELFGALTGNGFAELAAFDGDRNGWIDENDAVYAKLQVWTRDASGADNYRSLAAADVGAIALANVATPFEIKDSQNRLEGVVRATGVYLADSGGAGTVQQIDLAV